MLATVPPSCPTSARGFASFERGLGMNRWFCCHTLSWWEASKHVDVLIISHVFVWATWGWTTGYNIWIWAHFKLSMWLFYSGDNFYWKLIAHKSTSTNGKPKETYSVKISASLVLCNLMRPCHCKLPPSKNCRERKKPMEKQI